MDNLQPEVSIIIVNYNVKEFLLKCFASVYKYCKTSFEIILIDNNSSDDSVSAIKQLYPATTIIENKFKYAKDATAGIHYSENEKGLKILYSQSGVFEDDKNENAIAERIVFFIQVYSHGNFLESSPQRDE